MRRGPLLATALAALLAGACGDAQPSAPLAPSASTSPASASAGAPSPTPTPAPTEDPDQGLIDAARAYALGAGFVVDTTTPPETAHDTAGYTGDELGRVQLRLEGGDGSGTLQVSFDEAGAIVAVDNQNLSGSIGQPIARSAVVKAAKRQLELAGISLKAATPRIQAISGANWTEWFVIYERSIGGYPVANWPMEWGLNGDKAYVDLRPDGTLAALYAIQPDAGKIPSILPTATLNKRLAKAANVSPSKLATYGPTLQWVRAYQDDAPLPGLTLGYCERHEWSEGWAATCVDAGTGKVLARQGGAD